MKRVVILIAALAAAGVGLWLSRTRHEVTSPQPVSNAVTDSKETLTVKTDGVEIFKKVLWRSPLPEDKILNAERRDWSEGKDISRWRWFLHVDASADLTDYLRSANVFGLRPAPEVEIKDAPAWFPQDFAAYEAFRAGALTVLFKKGSREFYATSQGKGFTKALQLQKPVPPPAPPQPQSRYPKTPPPSPEPGR